MSEILSILQFEVEYEPEMEYLDSGGWNSSSDNMYFTTHYCQSQESYGLREVKQSQSNISNRPDAQKWADSYLAGIDYPVKRIALELAEQKDTLEGTPPQGLVAVRDSMLETVAVEEFVLQKFSYTITENGMKVSIPLGELLPDIADSLKIIEDKIETNKEL